MPQQFLRTISLVSHNYSTFYVRHRDYIGQLTKIDTDLDRQDATFFPEESGGQTRLRAAYVGGQSRVPSFYLRHQNWAVSLQQQDTTFEPGQPPSPGQQLFIDDSSFHLVVGLADVSGVSLQSVNYPTRYLRHRDFQLYVEPVDTDLDQADATFYVVTGLMPVPAPDIK